MAGTQTKGRRGNEEAGRTCQKDKVWHIECKGYTRSPCLITPTETESSLSSSELSTTVCRASGRRLARLLSDNSSTRLLSASRGDSATWARALPFRRRKKTIRQTQRAAEARAAGEHQLTAAHLRCQCSPPRQRSHSDLVPWVP